MRQPFSYKHFLDVSVARQINNNDDHISLVQQTFKQVVFHNERLLTLAYNSSNEAFKSVRANILNTVTQMLAKQNIHVYPKKMMDMLRYEIDKCIGKGANANGKSDAKSSALIVFSSP